MRTIHQFTALLLMAMAAAMAVRWWDLGCCCRTLMAAIAMIGLAAWHSCCALDGVSRLQHRLDDAQSAIRFYLVCLAALHDDARAQRCPCSACQRSEGIRP